MYSLTDNLETLHRLLVKTEEIIPKIVIHFTAENYDQLTKELTGNTKL